MLKVKLYEIRNKVMIQNWLLQMDLQILIAAFFYKMYTFLLNLKKDDWKSKIQVFNHNMWNTKNT